jgi:malonate-semialdehyde dehydrogenase (acetylating)/methylmalonate-semialdehyde dehydrogenase
VQANLAAKNHCLIMPDAEPEEAINQLVGAGFGASGQRCMALSVAVFVGDSYNIIDGVVDKAKKLKIGAGVEDGVDVCPVAYKEVLEFTIY